MNDLEAELGLNNASDEDLARIKAALMAGQAPDSISEGTMDPMTVTGRGPVVQMPEEQIRGRSTMQMDPMEVRPRKTIKLDPMTIDPRAAVKIGDVSVSRSPSAVETGRPTTVADPGEDQSTRLLNQILEEENRPTTVAEPPAAPTGDQLANALRRQNEAGPAQGITPERRAAQAALERSKTRGQPMAEKVRTGPKLSDDGSDTAPAPAAGGGGGGPMNWLGGVALGSAPQRTKQQEAQEALQRGLSSLNANRKASVAAFARNVESGMNTAYGTQNPHTAGVGLAEAGQANLRATLAEQQAKEGNRRAAAGEQATENQQAMAATQMNAGLAEKSRGINNDEADRDPMSAPSKAARAEAVSLYPKEVARIPPDQFKNMSRRDVQLFFSEAQQMKPTGGGGGMKQGDLIKWSNKIPKETRALDQFGQQADAIVQKAGGWDQIKGIGFTGSALPAAAVAENENALRQIYTGMKNSYIKQFAGTAVSASEEARMNAALGAVKFGHTAAQVATGIDIMRRLNQENFAQSMTGAPKEIIDSFSNDFKGTRTDILGNIGHGTKVRGTPEAQAAGADSEIQVINGVKMRPDHARKVWVPVQE